MSRRRRWLLGGLAVLVLLPLLAVLLLYWLFDPDGIKPRLERVLAESAGITLQLDGPLHWRAERDAFVFTTGTARATRPGVFSARWQAFGTRLPWATVLREGRLIEEVSFDALELTILAGEAQAVQTPPGPAPAAAAPAPPAPVAAQAPAPAPAGAPWRIAHFALRAATIRLGVASAPESLTRIEQLQARAALTVDPASGRIGAENLEVRGLVHRAPLPPAGARLHLAVLRLVLDPAAPSVEAPAIDAELAQLRARLRLAGPLDLAAPAGTGTLALETASLRELAAGLGAALPPTRDASVFGAVAVTADWRLAAAGLRLEPLGIRADGHAFTGSMSVPFAPDAGPVRFELAGDRLDLDRYLRPRDQPGEPFELPLEALRAARVEGVLRLREARLAGATLQDVRLRVHDRRPAP